MTDEEFLQQIESCTLPREMFTHRNHVRLAWLCLTLKHHDDPALHVGETIQRYAESLGASRKYNHELTMEWMRVVETAIAATPAGSFDEFAAANPELLNALHVKTKVPLR
jgi:hypothetical protein